MKKIFTFSILPLIAAALMLLNGQHALAQEASEIVGYTNIYIKVCAAPQEGGTVCVYQTQSALKIHRAVWEYKATVPVGSLMGVNIISYYVNNRPADGYTFAGWYEDSDGDGAFDINNDDLISQDGELLEMPVLEDDAVIYATEAEAKAAAKPTEPQRVLFAHYTNGAVVDVAYRQGEMVGNCGMAYLSKTINSPGDEVTARAVANNGFQFEYWEDAPLMGNIVSRDANYTFTVKGGERLYAYFTAIDAPVAELPEEGGFKVMMINAPWIMTEESMRNGAHVLVMEAEDLVRTADGKTYLDMTKEDCHIDVSQQSGLPTLVYGKGTVRFAFKDIVGYARKTSSQALVRWSGNKGTTVTGENLYVYLFHEDVGAFVQYANSDVMVNPDASTKMTVPAGYAYIVMSAYDIVDMSTGVVPAVIGLSPETFDRAVAGIDGVTIDSRDIQGHKIYTLSGVQVKATSQPGVYIVNGRKVAVK